MGRSMSRWQWIALAAVALSGPAIRAEEPVEAFKRALQEKAWERAGKIMPKLRSLSDLRRSYFTLEWRQNPAPEAIKLRAELGDRLVQRVEVAAAGDTEYKIAACILIAELGENEQPERPAPGGKFASRFTGLLIGGKKSPGLVHSDDIRVRQAAIYALGKITPPPADAMPVLRAVLKTDQLTPRRLAAYALDDLVKNSSFLLRDEEVATLNQATAAAVAALEQPDQDEQIRGYCLQTVQSAARVFTEYRWATKFELHYPPIVEFEIDKKTNKLALKPGLQELLRIFQGGMPRIIAAMEGDHDVKVRLTAADTINQIISARFALCGELLTKTGAESVARAELLKQFAAPDPIEPLLNSRWAVIPSVVNRSENVRLKRTMMTILERIAEDVELYLIAHMPEVGPRQGMIRRFVQAITPSLSDPDTFVRWSAARALRYVSPDFMDDAVVTALGRMLINPEQRDPDLSAAAALTLDVIAAAPVAGKAIGFLRSAIADPTMDTDNRIAAMKALVSIGSYAANEAAANDAYPELIKAAGAVDRHVRREACLTMGQLGHPNSEAQYAAAIAALKIAMRDNDPEVRLTASEAILSIVPPR